MDVGRPRVSVPRALQGAHRLLLDRSVVRAGGAVRDDRSIKLVPTEWGPPTFEIDGIKMLPTAQVSPYADAEAKVALIQPRGKAVLDTCGGLGYFAACCIEGQAGSVLSFEKNPDVMWLRTLNPWSPAPGGVLELVEGDVTERIKALPGRLVRRHPARPAALRHCGRALFAGLLRSARACHPPQGAALPLHRGAEQAHQRPRRAQGGGEAPDACGVQGGTARRWRPRGRRG